MFNNYAAGAIQQPHAAVTKIDVHAVRLASGFGSTQQAFADVIGVPVKTVRNWEQDRRKPTGPALVLLRLIQRNPGAVASTLKAG